MLVQGQMQVHASEAACHLGKYLCDRMGVQLSKACGCLFLENYGAPCLLESCEIKNYKLNRMEIIFLLAAQRGKITLKDVFDLKGWDNFLVTSL